MVDDGELAIDYYSQSLPTIYRLPTTTGLKELKLKHELLCGNLYVAFELTGKLDWWEAIQDYDSFGLKPDRQMIYEGKIVFWEVDRGTEDYFTDKGIKGKIDRYIALSKSRPERRFHVCFTTVDNKQSAETRAGTILELIKSYNRCDQLMVTLHKWAVEMPDLAPYMTLSNPMGVSILGAT